MPVIDNMPDVVYQALPGFRSTTIKNMLEGPEYYHHRLLNPETSDAMELGIKIHQCILEPEEFKKYRPKVPWNTKAGKAQKAEVEAGKFQVISAKDKKLCEGMRDSFLAHSKCSELLGMGTTEVVAHGDIYVDGLAVQAKAKADLLCDHEIADIKSCANLPRYKHEVLRLIEQYDYDLSAAWYLDVFNEMVKDYEIDTFHWIFIEKEAPHRIVTASAKNDSSIIERGRENYKECLSRIRECVQMDFWGETIHYDL